LSFFSHLRSISTLGRYNQMSRILNRIIAHLYPSFVSIERVLEEQEKGNLPKIEDVYVVGWVTLGLFICRSILIHFFFQPLVLYFLRVKEYKKPEKSSLHEDFVRCPKASKTQMDEIAKKKNLTLSEVTDYFRAHRKYNSLSKKIHKFNETLWRLVIFISAVVCGLATTWDKPWLWNFKRCWDDWPFQAQPDNGYYVLYMFELGINLHLLLSICSVKRGDFLEMFVHHVATIGLISYSYLINFVRVGTIIMVLHDPSDIILEAAKCVHYMLGFHHSMQTVCDSLFVVFAITFFVLRLVIFPFVLRSTLIDTYYQFGPYIPWYIFNFLLFILLMLHIFWFYLISKMVVRAIRSGGVEKDIRSDDDDYDDNDDQKASSKKKGD